MLSKPAARVMADDPFLQVQADVLATLKNTRPLFTSYLRIRSLAVSPSSHELIQAHKELEGNLQEINTDLDDLVQSVRAVEQDPGRFGLDVGEVRRRSNLVKEIGSEMANMRKELSHTTKQSGSSYPLPDPSAFEAHENDEYAQFEQQRQEEIMHEQDEALDSVFRTVGNLRDQADVMGRELEEQGEMLEEVDKRVDTVGDKLQGGMKRLNHIIRKNEEKYSSWCIGLLIFVLVLLLILAIVL